MPPSAGWLACTLLMMCLAVPSTGRAQQRSACTSVELRDPARTVYRCEGGLIIEAEAAARLRIEAAEPGGVPTRAEIGGKAALIELGTRRPFQIRTPQAIASVRGTVYAVDVTKGATAVFVVKGRVRVERRRGGGAVTLRPGEGVDVAAGKALVVRRWPEPRVRSLLSRFGR